MVKRAVKILLILGFVSLCQSMDLERTRRSVFQFGNMVMFKTDLGFESAQFNGHGNYCGIGGSGPVQDPLDQCCKDHDDCWGEAEKHCWWSPYITTYNYEYVGKKIVCLSGSKCQKFLCNCDRKCANCFNRNKEYLEAWKLGNLFWKSDEE